MAADYNEPGGAPRHTNMNDVASHAGVSVMTVSNVINRPDIVSEKTKAKVLASMRELRYRKSTAATSLRLSKPTQIGYALPSTQRSGDGYMDDFLYSLAAACQAKGMHLTLIAAADPEDWLSACDALYFGGSAAGIIMGSIAPHDPRPAQLVSRSIPFAGYGQTLEGKSAPWSWVEIDEARGIELAVEHVVERGHRQLAFIGLGVDAVWSAARLEGYVAACRKHGLQRSVVADRVSLATDEIAAGEEIAMQLLQSESPPDAIICASDYLAVGAIFAVRAHGLVPGVDVAVTGFDDTSLTSLGAIGITSVRQPSTRIAQELVKMIIDPPDQALHLLLEPGLTIRSSTTGKAPTASFRTRIGPADPLPD
ncbi:LacI family DNA-binding transcriptional regulator [Paenarthrobacter sp. RAF54_2]|uniref:LacI family DNA-binding transcriptional regulator n=1 Tax=Micrococcaceae TaxID=1268 RepID=UPI003F902760